MKLTKEQLSEEYDRGFTAAQIHHHTLIDQYMKYVNDSGENKNIIECLNKMKHLIRIGYWDVSVFEE